MTDTVANLLALYAGMLLLNTLVAVTMAWIHRGTLYRDLVLVWGALMLAFAMQGATSAVAPESSLIIVMAFASGWLANLAFAQLIRDLFDVPVWWRSSVAVLAGGLGISTAAYLGGAHFTVVALPTALAVAYPLLVTSIQAVRERWGRTTPAARMLLLACLAITAHTLDFPFLRHIEEATAIGFTIAILVVFALSIFGMAVVAEVTAAQQARLSAEMEVAQRIQTKVLPSEPKVPGFELACHMQPAEEVGGDYYDVYTLGEHSWILLGDVTGHGLSSGLVMLMAQSVLASILHTREEISPAELAYLANRVLYQNLRRLEELRSMTLVALCRTGDGGRFVYSGNHDHLYVWRAATGRVECVQVAQVPHDLGFADDFPRTDYSEGTFEVAEGDLIMAATDGIVEAPMQGSHMKGMFEEKRLIELLEELGARPLAEIKQRLLAELDRFTGGVYHDDVTFVLARSVALRSAQ